ncbi:hypothetical protein RCH21_001817 [Arthrobacter sp. PL16]|nr:hypothetical protein [Arthrobacter sp. PL16]
MRAGNLSGIFGAHACGSLLVSEWDDVMTPAQSDMSRSEFTVHHPDDTSAVAGLDTVPGTDGFGNCPTGSFRFYLSTCELHWSDDIYQIHSYRRGGSDPTSEPLRGSVLPGRRNEGHAFREDVMTLGGPLSVHLTLRSTDGSLRQVLITGDTIEENDTVVGVSGVLFDLTAFLDGDFHRLTREAVAGPAKERGVIEQAKGILMGQTGINADDAFRLISQRSQKTHRKVNEVAQAIVDQASHTNVQDTHSLFAARTILDSF